MNDFEIDSIDFDKIEKDEAGNEVYICEAICLDCQSND